MQRSPPFGESRLRSRQRQAYLVPHQAAWPASATVRPSHPTYFLARASRRSRSSAAAGCSARSATLVCVTCQRRFPTAPGSGLRSTERIVATGGALKRVKGCSPAICRPERGRRGGFAGGGRSLTAGSAVGGESCYIRIEQTLCIIRASCSPYAYSGKGAVISARSDRLVGAGKSIVLGSLPDAICWRFGSKRAKERAGLVVRPAR